MDSYRQKVVEIAPERIRTLLEGCLAAAGERLHEYARQPGVYYFDLPDRAGSARAHYADVVFDREQAVADDGLTFLHLNHPLVQRLMAELLEERQPAAAQLRVRADQSGGAQPERGVWAVYRLQISNYTDMQRQELIPVFLDENGRSQPGTARRLMTLTPQQVDTAVDSAHLDLPTLQQTCWQVAEGMAADRFSEVHLSHHERLNREREKISRYYQQQERAVTNIAIENIRQAKQRELLERRRADLAALEKRKNLVPDLELIGMAVVA
jgi:hypothetical protein